MAKRFRDTKLTHEVWYRKLSPVNKCAWNYILDMCDQVGMWAIDQEAMNFFVGAEVDLNDFLELVNKDKVRIEKIDDDKLFIIDFISFQYGKLSEQSPAHKPIFLLIEKYRLMDRLDGRLMVSLQEKEKEKEKEMEGEKEKEKRKHKNQKTEPASDATDSHTQEEIDLFTSFVEWIEKNAPKVNQMREPVSIKQFLKLRNDYPGQTGKELIHEIILAMHNNKDLLKKYESANLTIRSWINIRKKRNEETGTETSTADKLSKSIRSIREQKDRELLDSIEVECQNNKTKNELATTP